MFCDLVGSTPLAEKLDPEDLREVILAYQQVCAEQIRRCDGHLARYVGDGLLVYFGYPQAHEDDAQRAIRAGLGMVAALPELNSRVQQTACRPSPCRCALDDPTKSKSDRLHPACRMAGAPLLGGGPIRRSG